MQSGTAARIAARPGTPDAVSETSGILPIALVHEREGLLYVPPDPRAAGPLPLAVVLHGAGVGARQGLNVLLSQASERPMLLFAPQSLGRTWDVLLGGFGPDVTAIDHGLRDVFQRYAVDANRLAIAGFSDGASYALSLGLTNGDLFSHVLAFSPGFASPAAQHGAPRVFISHGTADRVLPIDRCSRRIVPTLERAGYDVQYREFEGGHVVPPDLAAEAAELLTS